jgi:hypothetical protein
MRLTWQAFASAGAQRNVPVALSSGQKTYPLLAPADAVRVEVRGKGRPPRLQHCSWLPWRVVALGGVEGGYCLHTHTRDASGASAHGSVRSKVPAPCAVSHRFPRWRERRVARRRTRSGAGQPRRRGQPDVYLLSSTASKLRVFGPFLGPAQCFLIIASHFTRAHQLRPAAHAHVTSP